MCNIKEIVLTNGDIYFPLTGLDDWGDFKFVVLAIKNVIMPEYIEYKGITDISGYFIKNAQRIDIEYEEMVGNGLIWRKQYQNQNNVNIVRKWVNEIFKCCLIIKKNN